MKEKKAYGRWEGFWVSQGSVYHVEELLKQALCGLALAPQHLVEMGIANALLKHLLQACTYMRSYKSPRTSCITPRHFFGVKNPNPICAWGHPPPIPTFAEGELLMMAVSTLTAWTAMASEPLSKTCGTGGGSAVGITPNPTRQLSEG